MSLRIAPSIISADLGNLAQQIEIVERGGADLIHVDVMDGCFVPNLTVGIPVVKAIKSFATVPLDVHLMIVEPERHIEAFVQAGASMLSVHVEASPHLHRTLSTIRTLGAQAGAVLNPSTPASALEPVIDLLDFTLVMSVNPGFSGQRFIPQSMSKVRQVRDLLDRSGSQAALEIDGGIDQRNAAEVVAAGADILVAASAIFATGDPASATRRLRDAALSSRPVSNR